MERRRKKRGKKSRREEREGKEKAERSQRTKKTRLFSVRAPLANSRFHAFGLAQSFSLISRRDCVLNTHR